MLRCRDIVRHADVYLAGEMSFWRRLGFQLHLLLCRDCRRYVRELVLTTEVSRRMAATGHAEEDRVGEIVALWRREPVEQGEPRHPD